MSALCRWRGPSVIALHAQHQGAEAQECARLQAGFRLFGFELRVATRLVWKQLQGEALTRRERKQLTRTTADLFRMVPFTLFIIIPFAEFLLPVALRLFPNMLPSTFQTQLKQVRPHTAPTPAPTTRDVEPAAHMLNKCAGTEVLRGRWRGLQEEDTKKLLKLKTELARFLQQTVGEVAKDVRRSRSGAVAADAKALYSFLKDVRAGKNVSNKDIMQFATLFSDELTLDNLDRVHLVTLCQVRPLQVNFHFVCVCPAGSDSAPSATRHSWLAEWRWVCSSSG